MIGELEGEGAYTGGREERVEAGEEEEAGSEEERG
jgi:hypothetical protein